MNDMQTRVISSEDAQRRKAIKVLAEYFTCGAVGHNSILLQAGGLPSRGSELFFDAQKRLGLSKFSGQPGEAEDYLLNLLGVV